MITPQIILDENEEAFALRGSLLNQHTEETNEFIRQSANFSNAHKYFVKTPNG
ncbi:MAG: hypothetical protein ACKVIK_08510 [Rhodospirillales bacterium]|jgi:predicted Rossmann fold nucleotide-binding protein DprA/Smf involved in DNA uptake